MRTGLLIILFLLAQGPGMCQDQDTAPYPPNVVLILTDDQGWGDLSLHGNQNLQTPNIDRIALEGARFKNFYVQPVCSPTRAEILTGRSFPRLGVSGTSAGAERIEPGVTTLAEVFRSAGYATGLFGKWHNGSQAPYHPNFRGFEEFYGFTSGHWGHYFGPELEHNQQSVRGTGYLPDDLTSQAIAYMEDRSRPFFVLLAYNTPHSPMQVPQEHWEAFKTKPIRMRHKDEKKEDLQFTRAALAMVENLDDNIGRILHFLDTTGRSEQTIVLFLSDNGPNSYRWNGGLKGRKGSTDEGGVKTNLFIRWPDRIPKGYRTGQPSGSVDVLPTLGALARIQLPDTLELDGVDLTPALLGGQSIPRPAPLFHHWGGKTSVRDGDFRLDASGRLYHIESDREQNRDVSARYPKQLARLKALKDRWVQEVLAPAETEGTRPFTVGYPGALRTVLPARDGVAHGSVERSNQYPNASFFNHWKSTDDMISWKIFNYREGRYRVVVHYTLAEADRGVRLVLENQNDSLTAVLTEAFDPPLRGAEEDRVPRMESYVKQFKEKVLGEVYLRPGRDTIWLKAPVIPGEQGPDILKIVLEPIP